MYHKSRSISVLDGDVCKSDTLAPSGLRRSLVEAVKALEDIDPSARDWNPNSEKQILNLVDPSLFPLIYGRSRILPTGTTNINNIMEKCTDAVLIPRPTADDIKHIKDTSLRETDIENSWSTTFQWLPCNVGFLGDGTQVQYVSNSLLH